MAGTSGTGDPGQPGFAADLDRIFGPVRPEAIDAVGTEARQINARVTELLAQRETGNADERATADAELAQIRQRLLDLKASADRGRDSLLIFSALAGDENGETGRDDAGRS